MNTDKIEIKDLYLVFGHDKQKALKMLRKGKTKQEILKETGCTIAVNNANFTIRQGEIFVIMGLSGSGKSSLLRCLNLLNRPTSGKVIVNGKDIAHMGIAFYADGKLTLIHASSKEGKVVASTTTLTQMLQDNDKWTGIRVLRMKK